MLDGRNRGESGMNPQWPHVDTAVGRSYPGRGKSMMSSPITMRAVQLSTSGPVDNLRLTTLPLPPERDGWVRIRARHSASTARS